MEILIHIEDVLFRWAWYAHSSRRLFGPLAAAQWDGMVGGTVDGKSAMAVVSAIRFAPTNTEFIIVDCGPFVTYSKVSKIKYGVRPQRLLSK